MGLYNFHPRFEEPIVEGIKTHTIRANRKYPDKPGDTMYLYVGLRHPGARRIIPPPTCKKVETIAISLDGTIFVGDFIDLPITLAQDEMEQLAKRDGFKDHAEMMSFWVGRLPFLGRIYHWTDAAPRRKR